MIISIEDISKSAETYFKKLDAFVIEHGLTKREPSTIAWKVTDINEFNDTLSGFLKGNLVIQCHIGFVDKRYIASVVFKQPIYRNVSILKLMQRRPGSSDPVGLDHADFPVNNLSSLENEFKAKNVPKWSHESNEVHSWISAWLDGTEAKFVDHIVLDVGVKELQDITKQLGFEPKVVEQI
jgi:hypothetical protein